MVRRPCDDLSDAAEWREPRVECGSRGDGCRSIPPSRSRSTSSSRRSCWRRSSAAATAPQDRLPTEHELCERYGISRTPVTPRAVGARRGGRDPAAPATRVVRQPALAAAGDPTSRRCASSSPQKALWAGMIRGRRRRRQPGQHRHGPARVAAPDADPRRGRGGRAGPRGDRLGLDAGVRRGGVPPRARGPRRGLDPRRARGRLPRAARGLESLRRPDVRHPRVRATWQGSGTASASSRRSGSSRPETWAELRAVARAIAGRGMPHPIVMPGGSKGGETTAYCLIAFLASNGARVLQPEGVSLDSPRDGPGAPLPPQPDRGGRHVDGRRRATSGTDRSGCSRRARRDQLRRHVRGAGARRGARRLAPRALAGLRLHGGARRAPRRHARA